MLLRTEGATLGTLPLHREVAEQEGLILAALLLKPMQVALTVLEAEAESEPV